MAAKSSRLSTRLSGFRFSLMPPRSPMSPVSPASVHEAPLTNNADQSLSICHSSGRTSPTARGSPSIDKDNEKVVVTAVDGETGHPGTPRALPSPSRSPMTPWHLSFHRNAASAEHEAAYLRKSSTLNLARTVFSTLLVCTGGTILGLQSDVYQRYRASHLPSAFGLSLWPTDLDLRPAVLCLATGAVTLVLAFTCMMLSVIPSPKPRTKLNIACFSLLSVVTTILSLVSIIFAGAISPGAIFGTFVVNTVTNLVSATGPANTSGLNPVGAGDATKRETIQSFTCAIANSAASFNKNANELKLPSMNPLEQIVPSGFGQICTESRAALAIVLVTAIVAAFGVALAGISWINEAKIGKLRNEREAIASRDGQNVPESLVGMPYEKNDVEH